MERQKRRWLTRREKAEILRQIRREDEAVAGTIAGEARKLVDAGVRRPDFAG
jgi:hypothetical protein